MADDPVMRLMSPNESAQFVMTIGGDGRSFSTREIPKDRLNQTYSLSVSYRSPGAPSQLLGRYALNLAKMLEEGLVRIERRRTGAEVVRLIVQQQGEDFYVQLNQDAPRLRLPRS